MTPHYAKWDNGSKTPCFCTVEKDHPIGETAIRHADLAIVEAVQAARAAAEGDSNDAEIEALQYALDLALEALGIEVPE